MLDKEALNELKERISYKPFYVQDFGSKKAKKFNDIDMALSLALTPSINILTENPTELMEGSVFVVDFSHVFTDGVVDEYEAEFVRKGICIDVNTGATVDVSTIDDYELTEVDNAEDVKFLLNLYCETENLVFPWNDDEEEIEDDNESDEDKFDPNSLVPDELIKLILSEFGNETSKEEDEKSEDFIEKTDDEIFRFDIHGKRIK